MPDLPAVRDRSWLCLLPALVLVPWLGKAFHIDDTQFLIYARLIAEQPLNPYTQVFEWDGMRVAIIDFPHPLLWQYGLAVVRWIFGESEVAMHALTLSFGFVAMAALRGLAQRLDVPALPACVLLAGSSAFAVMGSTIMPDLAAMALSLAALERGVAAVEQGRRRDILLAGVLAAAAFLTRFTAAFSIGLLFAYPLLRRKRELRAYAPAAVAAGIALLSELASFALAGRAHFWSSLFRWSSDSSWSHDLLFGFDEVMFLGAQFPITAFVWVAVAARGRRSAIAALAAAAVGMAAAWRLTGDTELWLATALFAGPGLAIVFDSAERLLGGIAKRFDAADPSTALRWLLAATVIATTFATVRYEHVAVKYLLLPLPGAILLLLDGLRDLRGRAPAIAAVFLWVSCGVGAVTGTAVALSDYRWANSYRDFVDGELADRPRPAGKFYYNAQWGLRHYAERAGLVPYRGGALASGDELLLSATVPPNWEVGLPAVVVASRYELSYPGPFALLSFEHHAGFYSNFWGHYPFVPATDVRDTLVIVRPPLRTPPSAQPSPR